MPNAATISLSDLDAILSEPCEPAATWVHTLCSHGDAGLDDIDLWDIASERDPRGPEATIGGVLGALRVRCAHDHVALALLGALELVHLPNALGVARGV